MRRTGSKEVSAVLHLDGQARLEHFVKRVADSERAWGLWRYGWALMANEDGTEVFPLWPAPEYAEPHRAGSWVLYQVKEIPLGELLAELLPTLNDSGILPGVFPSSDGKCVTPSANSLAVMLRAELERY